jgi:hypothetical protein
MKLSTLIRPFTDTEVIEGRITDQQREAWDEQVRQGRLEVARGRQNWDEIPESRLVSRASSSSMPKATCSTRSDAVSYGKAVRPRSGMSVRTFR